MTEQRNQVFCFLDLETTGHDPLKRVNGQLIIWHEIIELGAVFADSQNLEKLGEFEIKIKPEHPERCLPNLVNDFPARYARGEWEDSTLLSGAISGFMDRCGKLNTPLFLVGQNFSFDWLFVTTAFAWCGIQEDCWKQYFHYSRLDTRSMAVHEFLDFGKPYSPDDYSLRNARLSKHLDIPQEPYPHEALNGARQSYLVFRKLRELQASK